MTVMIVEICEMDETDEIDETGGMGEIHEIGENDGIPALNWSRKLATRFVRNTAVRLSRSKNSGNMSSISGMAACTYNGTTSNKGRNRANIESSASQSSAPNVRELRLDNMQEP